MAATSSWSASRTASRGCGSSATARAARRRRRRSSWRSRRRSRRRRRTSRASRSRASRDAGAPAARVRAAGGPAEDGNGAATARRRPPGRSSRRAAPAAGTTAPSTVGGARPARRQRRRHAARLPQRVRLVPGAARRRADGAGRDAHVPVVRAPLRAAARRPLARRRAAPDRAGAAAARRGARAGGGRADGGAAARRSSPASGASCASRRRAGPPARRRAGRAASCARSRSPAEHKHLLDLEERRIVCVCPTCWSMRSGDARYRPTGSRTLWLEDFDAAPTSCGRRSRSRSASRSSCARARRANVVGLYPSPAGATECELDLDAWDRLVAANPVLEDLDPDAEALIVNRLADAARARDRAARRLLPARRDHQGDLGGHHRRRGDGGGGRSATSTTCAPRRRCDERRSAAPHRARVHGARRRADRARGDAGRALPPARQRSPTGREVYTIALSTQIQIDPARRTYDDATRARLVELFGAPERWGATTHSFQWARIELARAVVHRLDHVHGRGALHLRPRGRSAQVLRRRCPTARCR